MELICWVGSILFAIHRGTATHYFHHIPAQFVMDFRTNWHTAKFCLTAHLIINLPKINIIRLSFPKFLIFPKYHFQTYILLLVFACVNQSVSHCISIIGEVLKYFENISNTGGSVLEPLCCSGSKQITLSFSRSLSPSTLLKKKKKIEKSGKNYGFNFSGRPWQCWWNEYTPQHFG